MHKTTLYLPPELQLALREAARRSGQPQAEIIRTAIAEHLRGQGRLWPRSIGVVRDGTLPARDVEAWLTTELGERG